VLTALSGVAQHFSPWFAEAGKLDFLVRKADEAIEGVFLCIPLF